MCADFAGSIRIPQTGSISVEDGAGWRTIAEPYAALRRAEEEILADHAAHCVENAIASGNKTEQRRKVAELIDVISRSNR